MIRPSYYEDENGHDLFWKMEHWKYPVEWSIGFCHINADKYKRRLGKKSKDVKTDLEKSKTYHQEEIKLSKGLRPCSIIAWIPNEDDPNQGAFGEIKGLISHNEILKLRDPNPPKFLMIYVNDMDKWYVPTGNINQILEER